MDVNSVELYISTEPKKDALHIYCDFLNSFDMRLARLKSLSALTKKKYLSPLILRGCVWSIWPYNNLQPSLKDALKRLNASIVF